MQMRKIVLVNISFQLLTIMHVAHAETISFTGRVDTVPEALRSEIQPDMTVTGFYTFDESGAAGDFLTSVTDFQMVIGDYSVIQDPTTVKGDISVTPNQYTVVSIASGEPINEFSPILMALQLSSSSGIDDTGSPIPPPIEVFDNPLWTVDFASTGLPVRVEGTIQTLTVPEPSTSLMMAVGMIIAPIIAGRRRTCGYWRKPKRR